MKHNTLIRLCVRNPFLIYLHLEWSQPKIWKVNIYTNRNRWTANNLVLDSICYISGWLGKGEAKLRFFLQFMISVFWKSSLKKKLSKIFGIKYFVYVCNIGNWISIKIYVWLNHVDWLIGWLLFSALFSTTVLIRSGGVFFFCCCKRCCRGAWRKPPTFSMKTHSQLRFESTPATCRIWTQNFSVEMLVIRKSDYLKTRREFLVPPWLYIAYTKYCI